jgi:hypothetical protein
MEWASVDKHRAATILASVRKALTAATARKVI